MIRQPLCYYRLPPTRGLFLRLLHWLTRKWRFPYLYFKLACLSNIIRLLLLFKYPIKLDTLKCGGIVTSIWIWSGQHSASKISTCFLIHNSRRIFPISLLNFLYMICRLYLGANTMWYLHLHLLGDKLFYVIHWHRTSLIYNDVVARPLSLYH